MKRHLRSVALALFLVELLTPSVRATFYGEIPKGYQFVQKRGSGYGVYVPQSFQANKKPSLIFAFGRTRKDLALTREGLKDYATIWAEEAEKRGYVVVVPYWEPVLIEGGQHTERFYLDILEEMKLIYDIHPGKIVLAGFGLGAVEAFSLAAFYPDQFNAVVAIASSPLRDRVMSALMSKRLPGGAPPKNLPPILLIHGEEDGEVPASWLQEDKAFLERNGLKVELREIPSMEHGHDPKINSIILDWFEKINTTYRS